MKTIVLYRPVGPKELELIRVANMRAFPRRLPGQPIFYPVLNEEYAAQIARDWNVKDSGSGYVTRFRVDASYVQRFPAQTAGASIHQELWVPAQELEEFNRHIIGEIEITASFGDAMATRRERILGALWGAAIGDALGVPVEFKARDAVQADPVTGFRGFGTHDQPPGTWSDYTSLTLCTVESLVGHDFDLDDMGRNFARWYRESHWTPHGDVFDVGLTTADALSRIERGTRAESAGGGDEYSNGNGSLMRILPVGLRFACEAAPQLLERACRASAITHAHPRSQMCCGLYCLVVKELLNAACPKEAVSRAVRIFREQYDREPWNAQFLNLRRVIDGSFLSLPEAGVVSSGYVVHTLEAAIWCLCNTDSFESCVLKAVNFGGDSDTVGCVAGGLAGAYHGMAAIRSDWQEGLARSKDLGRIFSHFANTIDQKVARQLNDF